MPHFDAEALLLLQLVNCANQTSKLANQTSKSPNSGDDALESSHTSAFLNEKLPEDVLDIICKILDFEDIFQFSGVCKSWRTFHKSNFLSSHEPLLVRILCHDTSIKELYSFINIPNQKVYDLNIMSCFQPPNFTYIRASSGYFIMAQNNNSFVLFNPFTRIKKVINAPFTVHSYYGQHLYHALLAFDKFSDGKEFVLLVLCRESRTFYVYQSRYDSWVTYSTTKPEEIVDFVVLNNIIYVLTNHANIGVLSLNSGNIQFLNLNNTPKNIPSEYFWLLNCDEQLLMLDLSSRFAYKIDLSSMNYVKLKSLGDIALFYVSWTNCQALSNPRRFGYESNCVYEVNPLHECKINLWNNSIRIKTYKPPGSETDVNLFDWCFRHLKCEVDYSLVE